MRISVSTLFDQGSAPYAEDGLFVDTQYRLFAVMDGRSPPYLPGKGPRMFWKGHLTGGQLAIQFLKRALADIPPPGLGALSYTAERANSRLREYLLREDLRLDVPANLPSAAFAAVCIDGDMTTVVQCADCFALVFGEENRLLAATPNQVYLHEQPLRAISESLIAQLGKVNDEFWRHFNEAIAEREKLHVNSNVRGGYGVLNGQLEAGRMFYQGTVPTKTVRTVILFSDGLVPFPLTHNTVNLAREVMRAYSRGGLEQLLDEQRRYERGNASTSYTKHAEATAIAIEVRHDAI